MEPGAEEEDETRGKVHEISDGRLQEDLQGADKLGREEKVQHGSTDQAKGRVFFTKQHR